MKMILWKEWRENLKWALSGMLGLGLAQFLGLSGNDYQNEATLLGRSAFLMATAFGTAGVGVLLGLMQILPEQRRDQWAALLHRPVSRATILYGKIAAGLLLYLAATVPPFLACVWYVAAPGNFSLPFVPGMVLPALALIVGGAMFYFAALFVGLQRGKWSRSGATGFLAAMAVMFLSTAFDSFGWSVALLLFFAATFFVAARGAILSNGGFGAQPWISRVALVAIILVGTWVVGFVSLAFAEMFFAVSSPWTHVHYEVGLDGKPVKVADSSDGNTVVTDLDGKVIKDSNPTLSARYTAILRFVPLTKTFAPSDQPSAELDPWYSGYHDSQRYVMSARGAFSDAERWYYLPGERCFVGYIVRTRALIGAIGREGFEPGKKTAAPFPEPRLYTDYAKSVGPLVQFGSTVYFLSFDERKLTPIFTGPEGGIFGLCLVVSSYYEREEDPWKWGAVALRDYVQIITKKGELVTRLPYQWDVTRWGKIGLALNPRGGNFYLRCGPSDDAPVAEAAKLPDGLEDLNLEGKVFHSYTLPPLPVRETPEQPLIAAAGSLAPPVVGFGVFLGAKIYSLQSAEAARAFEREWDTNRAGYGKFAFRTWLASLLLAGLTLFWARRMNFPWGRAWAWTALVLAFNLAGLITFRLLADWPVRVKCPTCTRKRPVETESCPHCQAAWPTNAVRGTEIFETNEAVEVESL